MTELESGRFQLQRSTVRIQSKAKFRTKHVSSVKCRNDEIM